MSPGIGELHGAFIAFEEEHHLWDREAYGQRYWHNIRYEVWNGVVAAHGLTGPKQASAKDRPLWSFVDPRPRVLRSALQRSYWGDLGPAELLVFNHPRHALVEGAWICPYSEPLLQGLGRSRWVVETPQMGRHYHPNATQSVKYLDWEKFKANLRFGLGHTWRGGLLTHAEKRELWGWSEQLRRQLGGGPDPQEVLRLARKAVWYLVSLGELYERLLDRVQPRVVLQVVHYSYRNLVMTPLARARGIPVVELQHGFMGPTHLAYNVAPGRRPERFPDHLLLFGRWWRDITPGLPLAEAALPAIGYAHLEAQRARHARRSAPGPAVVLFISQGAVGKELSQVAAALAEALPADRYRIVYKLHPGELATWRKRYPWLTRAPLEVRDQAGDDLYGLFAGAHVQVGVYSTALFEGLAFGLPTYIVTLPGHEDMDALVARKLAIRVADAADLASAIREQTAVPSAEDLAAIWQPGATERFRDFMDQLLDRGHGEGGA